MKKICSPEKWANVHARTPDLSPIDRPYMNFCRHCTKMAPGIEVGLGPGNIVLDWDPAPLSKNGAEPPPQF